jgi:hypothetical protein
VIRRPHTIELPVTVLLNLSLKLSCGFIYEARHSWELVIVFNEPLASRVKTLGTSSAISHGESKPEFGGRYVDQGKSVQSRGLDKLVLQKDVLPRDAQRLVDVAHPGCRTGSRSRASGDHLLLDGRTADLLRR